jgi:hypothetical protein
MPYAMAVNSQNPTGTIASEPLRRRFNNAGGYEVISIPVFICIFVKGSQNHPCLQSDEISICILTRIFVGKTKQFAE